ncbi:polysulfide reductase NrfD [Evansella sp. AB-P1]|uniref:NrfD/PsrC family molybdoenzyme membrane anchor subunit n=1 Tax=Evansella sp. AB-P1 TaxID=3037653 RepID=UPI00241D7F7C|nr:NrfD/PsrC family molybdoenzyme membrane anchor subunit [Evansella sp. AB-P1]MDG5786094.1 polysulfide reductase NrfD [Evansella sp. AB-P1]
MKISLTKKRLIFVIITFIGIGIGLLSMWNTLVQGQVVFGSSDEVPWNILIVAYVFLALMASGMCLVSTFGHALGFQRFGVISKRSLYLAISVLLPALLVLAMDLGRIDRVFYFITSPNLTAPMWWMGATYGIYVIVLLVEFFAVQTKNHRIIKVTSYITLCGAIAATSILGGIFAVVIQRPLWFGGATSVFFVLSALITGIAMLLIATIVTYKVVQQEMSYKLKEVLDYLGKALAILLAVALGFHAWRLITLFYVSSADFQLVLNGEYSILFWGGVISLGLIIPILLLMKNRTGYKLVLAGVFVLIGMFVDKYITIIGGQIVQMSGEVASYSATLTEWGIIIGGIAASVFIYMLGVYKFSLDDPGDKHSNVENLTPSSQKVG